MKFTWSVCRGVFAIGVFGLLLSFAALPALGANKTFVVSSTWLPTGGMGNTIPDPDPIDSTSTIVIDTATGQVSSSSHVTASGNLLFFHSQQSGTASTQLTFIGGTSDLGGDTINITLNLLLPVASLVGYSGGPICDATNTCSAGGSNELVQCVGSNCIGTENGNFAANTGQLTPFSPVPYLNPLQPDAVAPGGPAFTLTVTGTGFVPTSTVNWNGSPRATTYFSNSQLGAAITAADIASPTTGTITVSTPGLGGGGTSNPQYFQVAYNISQLSWTFLSLSGVYPLTSRFIEGDFNGDGKLDLAVAMGSRAFVLPGNGDGTLGSAIPSNGPSGTITNVYAADVNGDGKLDLIVTGPLSTSKYFVATMLGNGDGSFQAPIETDFNGSIPTTGVLADFDGDGALDLAFTNGMTVQTLLGIGNGTFKLGPSTPLTQIGLGAVATGDFNHDGKLDLVVTVYDPFTTGLDFAGVMLGNGDGSFASLVPVNGTGASFVGSITAAVGDFNGDGKLDIATALQTVGATLQGIIQVSNGNGDGTFQAPYTVPNVADVTTPLLVADFNGDGNLDISTGGFIYYGQGNGTFPTSSGRTGLPTFILAGDPKNDGQQDLFTDAVTFNNSTVYHQLGLFLQIPPTPDFHGSVGQYPMTMVPGGSISIPITAESLFGFAGEIVVGAIDLPNGVTPTYNPTAINLTAGGTGNSNVTLTAANNMPLGHYNVTLTGSSGSLYHTTTVPFDVNDSLGDWVGYMDESNKNIAPGGSAVYGLATKGVNGFTGDITLNVSGLPPGATASFNPPTIVGGTGSSNLTVTTPSNSPQPATYAMTVTGTNGILVHSETIYLGVSSSGGDFGGTVNSTGAVVSASRGGSGYFQITATPINGGAGDLSLTTIGLPAGVFASFSPSATIPGSSGLTTLTLTATSGTPVGTWNVGILATGSGVVHELSVTLTVNP